MARTKPINPFYAALLAAGIAFAITALVYTTMMVRGANPHLAAEQGLVGWMARHGGLILVVELAILALLTFAAIGTDEWWARRASSPEPAGDDLGRTPERP